jgi:hypothetical protein
MQTNQLTGEAGALLMKVCHFFILTINGLSTNKAITRSRRGCNISAREMTAGTEGEEGQHGDK